MSAEEQHSIPDASYKHPLTNRAPPQSILEFLEALAPIAKYYAILLLFYYIAKRINRALDQEAEVADRNKKRPQLSSELMESSSEEEEEEEVHEELVTSGTRLVSVPGESKPTSKSHPLFEGLKQIEEDLRKKKENKEDDDVSWNELHMAMLKRYQDKYPGQGLRIQKDDDYDDEFKELMKKHQIDPSKLKNER